MSFKDKLKKVAHLTAAVSSVLVMHTAALPEQKNQIQESNEDSTTTLLDQRVERGTMINGETRTERSEKWANFAKKNGKGAALDAIRKEQIKKIELSHKDADGYVFITYEPGKGRSVESYYSNGVLRAKINKGGEKIESFYPDGSRKFIRTLDGIETAYHPGGEKGKEKIKETPHKLSDAYDVLDEQGQRIEHHYALAKSEPQKDNDGMVYTSRDVKKVDLYNPQTQEIIGTYTLDNWGGNEGRISKIGFMDEKGVMNTMDLPKACKNGDTNYYTASLSLDEIKEIYNTEKQERNNKQVQQKAVNDRVFQR